MAVVRRAGARDVVGGRAELVTYMTGVFAARTAILSCFSIRPGI